MTELICTNFTYEVPAWYPTFRGAIHGSYLGRKPASMATIRAFLRSNGTPRAKNIKIGASWVSPWISK